MKIKIESVEDFSLAFSPPPPLPQPSQQPMISMIMKRGRRSKVEMQQQQAHHWVRNINGQGHQMEGRVVGPNQMYSAGVANSSPAAAVPMSVDLDSSTDNLLLMTAKMNGLSSPCFNTGGPVSTSFPPMNQQLPMPAMDPPFNHDIPKAIDIKNHRQNNLNNSFSSQLDFTQPARTWWRYFRKMKENRAVCLTCGQIFNRGVKQSTTSLVHHLRTYHRDLWVLVQKAKDEFMQMVENGMASPGRGNSFRKMNPIKRKLELGTMATKPNWLDGARRLIQAVKQFPELYASDTGYWKRGKGLGTELDPLWERVAKVVGQNAKDSVLEMRKRWHHLRDKFKKELRLAFRDHFLYEPKWPHFREMIWLSAHMAEFKEHKDIIVERFGMEPAQHISSDAGAADMAGIAISSSSKNFAGPFMEAQSCCPTMKKEVVQQPELDEQELRDVADVLGIDISGVQAGELKRKLDGIDTSFLTDQQNQYCPPRETIQSIDAILIKGEKADGQGLCECSCNYNITCNSGETFGERIGKEKETCNPSLANCYANGGLYANEFGRMVSQRLEGMDERRRKLAKIEIQRILDTI